MTRDQNSYDFLYRLTMIIQFKLFRLKNIDYFQILLIFSKQSQEKNFVYLSNQIVFKSKILNIVLLFIVYNNKRKVKRDMDFINAPVVIAALSVIGLIMLVTLRKGNKANSDQNINTTKIDEKVIDIKQKSKPAQQPSESAESETKDKKKKNKKKKTATQSEQPKPIKTQKEIQQTYAELFYGSINLKPQQNSIHGPTCVAYKNSKILVGTTKNELVLYDLKKWKKQDPKSLQKYFVSLDNNTPTAVCIGTKYYYVALGFDKTIVYYEFVGEKGVYFQESKRFFRNILKSDASAIFVPQSENFIITAGSQADTTLNVWSMKGDKLHTFNTYQIEHYDIRCCLKTIMVRGWTSEVKLFRIETDKTGAFSRIEKEQPLSIPDQPLCSSIDNLTLHGLTVSKEFKITLWDLHPSNPSKPQLKIAEPYQIQLDQIENCLVHTLKDENERYKTFLIFTDKSRIVICDRDFSVQQIINGVQCKALEIIGSVKNVVLITQTKQDKLVVWNLTKVVEKLENFTI